MLSHSPCTIFALRSAFRARPLTSAPNRYKLQIVSKCACSSTRLTPSAKDIHDSTTVIQCHSMISKKKGFLDSYKESYLDCSIPLLEFSDDIEVSEEGKVVQCSGYLRHIVTLGPALVFARVADPISAREVQVIARNSRTCAELNTLQVDSPINVSGVWRKKHAPKKSKQPNAEPAACPREGYEWLKNMEIEAVRITCLNTFPRDLNRSGHHPPERRHLQIRFDEKLRNRLLLRSRVANYIRQLLQWYGFSEIETPILFKSTPEGAREFIVPSRREGYAYALPQSPQQYKQILIASGIERYYQFARCFRDEDLRADRQPEFTQIDLEMAFADGDAIRRIIEQLIFAVYHEFSDSKSNKLQLVPELSQVAVDGTFPSMEYSLAMSKHGSDKPDLRINGLINCIDSIVTDDLRHMLTDLEEPTLEAFKLRLSGSPEDVRAFVNRFMESNHSEPFRSNPDGNPGFAIYDSRKPLSGLQIFGFEGASDLRRLYAGLPRVHLQTQEAWDIDRRLDDGDLIVIQARKRVPLSGGSTMLGRLRIALQGAALKDKLITHDRRHHYLWVTDFPMFTPENGRDPGQGGKAGFAATHHPFTAPKSRTDVDLLLTNPIFAVADHYDLVVNGIELGGGSRRIHDVRVQKYVMKDVLQMSDERISDFSHLFAALEAGCPPHAGIALGFDRLMAVLTEQDSVKDVIAFPKSSKGDDLMVRSPSLLSDTDLEQYHLKVLKRAAVSR